MGFFSDAVQAVSGGVDKFFNITSAPVVAAGKIVGQEDLAKSVTSFSNPVNFFDASRRKSVLLPSIAKAAPLGISVATGSPIPAALAYGGDSLNKFGLSGSQKNAEFAARIASGDYSAIGDLVDSKIFPENEAPNLPGQKLEAAKDFGSPIPVLTGTNWLIVAGIVLVPVLIYFIFKKKKGS